MIGRSNAVNTGDYLKGTLRITLHKYLTTLTDTTALSSTANRPILNYNANTPQISVAGERVTLSSHTSVSNKSCKNGGQVDTATSVTIDFDDILSGFVFEGKGSGAIVFGCDASTNMYLRIGAEYSNKPIVSCPFGKSSSI